MPRKGPVTRRDIFQIKFIIASSYSFYQSYMVEGKRGAETILYNAFNLVKDRSGKEPMEAFEQAIKNIMPVLEVKARRVGGANYQVPIEVRPDRRSTLGLRWLVNYSRLRGEKTMEERFAA